MLQFTKNNETILLIPNPFIIFLQPLNWAVKVTSFHFQCTILPLPERYNYHQNSYILILNIFLKQNHFEATTKKHTILNHCIFLKTTIETCYSILIYI
jgi:predicted metalloenzyme YecM